MDICQIAKEKIKIVIKNKRDFRNNKHSKNILDYVENLRKNIM